MNQRTGSNSVRKGWPYMFWQLLVYFHPVKTISIFKKHYLEWKKSQFFHAVPRFMYTKLVTKVFVFSILVLWFNGCVKSSPIYLSNTGDGVERTIWSYHWHGHFLHQQIPGFVYWEWSSLDRICWSEGNTGQFFYTWLFLISCSMFFFIYFEMMFLHTFTI